MYYIWNNLFSKEYHFKKMKLTLVFFVSFLFFKHNFVIELGIKFSIHVHQYNVVF